MSVRQYHRRLSSGHTMLETVVTMFILAIVLIVVTQMFLVLLRTFNLYTARVHTVQEASDISRRFLDWSNNATAVDTATHIIGGTNYTTSSSTLVLKEAAIDATGSPIANAYDYVILAPDPANTTRLQEIIIADAASSRKSVTKLLGDSVQEHIFTYRDADPATANDVFFSVTVRRSVSGIAVTHTLHTYAKLRNATST